MKYLLLSLTFILSSCATVPLVKETQSGKPEGTFVGLKKSEVKEKIMNACISAGSMVEDSESTIVCSKEMEGASASMYKSIAGNSYSSTPEYKARFNIVQLNKNVKVVIHSWIEMQNSFGKVDRNYTNDNKTRNTYQNLLFRLGAK